MVPYGYEVGGTVLVTRYGVLHWCFFGSNRTICGRGTRGLTGCADPEENRLRCPICFPKETQDHGADRPLSQEASSDRGHALRFG